MQKELEGHEEAQNELMLVDDEDAARFLFGQCFVHTSTDDADGRITKGVHGHDAYNRVADSRSCQLSSTRTAGCHTVCNSAILALHAFATMTCLLTLAAALTFGGHGTFAMLHICTFGSGHT